MKDIVESVKRIKKSCPPGITIKPNGCDITEDVHTLVGFIEEYLEIKVPVE